MREKEKENKTTMISSHGRRIVTKPRNNKKRPRNLFKTSTNTQKSPKMIMVGRCVWMCVLHLDIFLWRLLCDVAVLFFVFCFHRAKKNNNKPNGNERQTLCFRINKVNMYCWRSVWSVGSVGRLEIRIVFLVLFLIDFFLVFRVCQNTHTKPNNSNTEPEMRMLATKWSRKKPKKRARCVLCLLNRQNAWHQIY